jgi:hypothetical protein
MLDALQAHPEWSVIPVHAATLPRLRCCRPSSADAGAGKARDRGDACCLQEIATFQGCVTDRRIFIHSPSPQRCRHVLNDTTLPQVYHLGSLKDVQY